MADSPKLPGAQAWKDAAGKPLPVDFWRFLRDLSAVVSQSSGNTTDLAALLARVAAIEADTGSTGSISAPYSVAAFGNLADGLLLQLVNDQGAPGPTTYYGTDATGAKGYHALTAGLADTATVTLGTAAFQHSETVAAVGVTPASVVLVSLAPVVDADANDPEMLDVVALWATPGTDTITFGLTFSTKTVGPVKLNWSAV